VIYTPYSFSDVVKAKASIIIVVVAHWHSKTQRREWV